VFGRRNRRTAGWRRRARDSILLCRRRLVIGGRWVSGVRLERTGLLLPNLQGVRRKFEMEPAVLAWAL